MRGSSTGVERQPGLKGPAFTTHTRRWCRFPAGGRRISTRWKTGVAQNSFIELWRKPHRMERKAFSTEQESFWAGAFGTEYIHRNKSAALLAANLNFFSNALKHAGNIESCIEFGANIGMNLQALALLFPGMRQQAIEINADAARELAARLGEANVFNGSIFEWTPTVAVDLALVKGVLIHINPGRLADVYRALHDATRRWILVCEYY